MEESSGVAKWYEGASRVQLRVYVILVLTLAVISAVSVLTPVPSQLMALQELTLPKWLVALGAFGIMIVNYGPLGLLGFYLTRRLGWAGIFNERERWRRLLIRPMFIGFAVGVALIVGERSFLPFHDLGCFPYPPFPFSVVASLGAGIGEELLFRLFFLSFWAFILGCILKRILSQGIISWMAIAIAAVAFGAMHLPNVMYLYGFKSLGDLPPAVIVELLVLNGIVGVIAGVEFIKYGLIAAIGIHFWADIVWHVIYGLF